MMPYNATRLVTKAQQRGWSYGVIWHRREAGDAQLLVTLADGDTAFYALWENTAGKLALASITNRQGVEVHKGISGVVNHMNRHPRPWVINTQEEVDP